MSKRHLCGGAERPSTPRFADQQRDHPAGILDCVPVGIAVFDKDLKLQRCNRAWELFAAQVSSSGARLEAMLEQARMGAATQVRELCSESGGEIACWDVTFKPLLEDDEIIGLVGTAVDATGRVLNRRELDDRTRELSALRDVMAATSASLELETVLERSLDQVLKVMESEVGTIHLLGEDEKRLRLAASRGVPADLVDDVASVPVGGGLVGWVVEHGEPLVVPNLAESRQALLAVPASGGPLTYIGVPVRAWGKILGVLGVVGAAGRQFDEGEVALLASIADQIGGAVENARLYRQAEQLAVVRERERLARELHDSVTQSLYSLTLLAEAGQRLIAVGNLERVHEYLGRLGEISQQALREMRLLVYQLRPLVLKREGLVGALQQRLDAVEKRAGVDARLLVEGTLDLPASVEEEFYRIAQEALNNALKHAEAQLVTVTITVDEEHVTLAVEDDGRGFDPKAVGDEGGMGLISIRERAEALGASLEIRSAPGGGATVRVSLEVRDG